MHCYSVVQSQRKTLITQNFQTEYFKNFQGVSNLDTASNKHVEKIFVRKKFK